MKKKEWEMGKKVFKGGEFGGRVVCMSQAVCMGME